jgi:hypothetical protein
MSAHNGAEAVNADGLGEQGHRHTLDAIAPILRQSMLWMPERQVVSAWIEHVPFAFWLVDVLAPRTIVELGTHNGVSYSAMCQAVNALNLPCRCFAVDTWQGDEHSGSYGEEIFQELTAFHDPRYAAFSRLVRSTFDEAVGHFEDGSIDILHIDGLHEYEAVRHDFTTWLPKLSRNAVVMLHDTNVRERGFGVARVWAEVSAERRHFTFLHGHGLGVAGVGREYPEPLSFLFDASGNEGLVTPIRRAFASLGRSAWLATDVTEGKALHALRELDQARVAALRLDLAAARLRAEVLQAKAQAGQAHAQRVRLETELHHALHLTKTEADAARADCARLQAELNAATRNPRLAAELQAARAEAEEARAESMRWQSEAQSLQGKIDAMAGSTSWRVTAPVRAAAAQLSPSLRLALRGSMRRAKRTLSPRAIARTLRSGHGDEADDQLAAEAALLAGSQWFDAGWYLARYPDVAAAGVDPVRHYLENGAAEGRDPGPRFSTSGYLARNADVAADGANPLLHYLRYGMQEGRNPSAPSDVERLTGSELFDRDWYLGTYPDVAAAGVDPAQHYLESGAQEGRDPGPHFSTSGYLMRNPDVAAGGLNPLLHYLQYGMREGRDPSPPSDLELVSGSELFDRDWYLRTYADVAAAGVDPVQHYLESGAREGRDPGPRFSTSGYLMCNPDVAADGAHPLLHYLRYGMREGRDPRPAGEAKPSPDPEPLPAKVAGPPRPDSRSGNPEGQDPQPSGDAARLNASEYFDRAWYLATYPDVAAAGVDPVQHYLESGAAEGRDPGPRFSSRGYLCRYHDVAKDNANPLVHYITFGISEGRDPSPPTDLELLHGSEWFDPVWYLKTYADIAAAGVDPAKHYLESGAEELRDPGPRFSTKAYLRRYPDVAGEGTNALLHYIKFGMAEGREISPPMPPTTTELLRMRFRTLWELPVFRVADVPKRVTMVTDSINAGSLFGGVGTAIVFSALLSRHLGADLRVATRTEPPDRSNLDKVFRVHGIDWQANVQFAFAKDGDPIEIGDNDLFVTTSWWTTRSTRRAVPARRICYLLQEDERMFYALGDEQLRCRETLSDPGIRFVVNSRQLFDHLVDEGFRNIAQNGIWFEPAFPKATYYFDDERPRGSKMQFFFYARPNNPRNLYYRGIEAIAGAIESGVLNRDEWDIHFVGKDLNEILLPWDIKPILSQNLDWPDYAALVRRTDVGLALMYTPHSSYPPLDLAASGAVAVTNRYGRKQSLAQYSNNIICVDDDLGSLVKGIADGIALARDRTTRMRNYEQNAMSRDWSESFRPVLQRFAATQQPAPVLARTA